MRDVTEDQPREAAAFPAALRQVVLELLPALSAGDSNLAHPSQDLHVTVQGEKLAIPMRVYYPGSNVKDYMASPGTSGVIALCLGTRHHNGYLRQQCVRKLLSNSEPWVIPYIVQLVGEYIAPVIADIEIALRDTDLIPYVDFLTENKAYFDTTERRVVSYWTEYYRDYAVAPHRRTAYPESVPLRWQWQDYPGQKVITRLRAAVLERAQIQELPRRTLSPRLPRRSLATSA